VRIKVAIFCPRFEGEAESAWQARHAACRLYLRQFSRLDGVEFDTLDHLKLHYPRHDFRRIIVAHKGYYSREFTDWVFRERVPVLDVLAHAPASPSEGQETDSLHARSRQLADQEARIRARWM